jgi:hypothetical protein
MARLFVYSLYKFYFVLALIKLIITYEVLYQLGANRCHPSYIFPSLSIRLTSLPSIFYALKDSLHAFEFSALVE